MSRSSIVSAAVLAACLVAGGATAAFAGVTPSPAPSTPTISPNFGYHPPKPRPKAWTFDLQQSDIALGLVNVDDVEGSGAIPMHLWRDVQLNPVTDKFVLGPNSVTIRHSPLPLPSVNLGTCTVTFDQIGHFAILRGTGTGANLRSRNGQFDLQGMVSFPTVRKLGYRAQVCPLAFLSPWTLRAIIASNGSGGLPAPTFTDFAVQGSASVFSTLPVVPAPYPTYTPTVSPTYATPVSS